MLSFGLWNHHCNNLKWFFFCATKGRQDGIILVEEEKLFPPCSFCDTGCGFEVNNACNPRPEQVKRRKNLFWEKGRNQVSFGRNWPQVWRHKGPKAEGLFGSQMFPGLSKMLKAETVIFHPGNVTQQDVFSVKRSLILPSNSGWSIPCAIHIRSKSDLRGKHLGSGAVVRRDLRLGII